MECGVCLEAMACSSYVSGHATAGEAGSAGATAAAADPDNVHRFPCGHAFHASCAIQSVLVSRRCPTCRASLDAHAGHEEESGSESDGLPMILHAHHASDPRMNSHSVMARVRSTSVEVQRERRAFRLLIAEYNRMHDRMRHRRRAALQEALGAFRRRHYASCDAAIRRVQFSLERVQMAEARAWQEQKGSAPEGQEWDAYVQRDATDYVGLPSRRCENMMDRRFWSLS
jgi:hypothetical protein